MRRGTGEDPGLMKTTLEKCFRNGMILRSVQENGELRYAFSEIYSDRHFINPKS